MAKKRGAVKQSSPKAPKMGRLELLKRKLELEQELLNSKSASKQKELKHIEKEYEKTEGPSSFISREPKKEDMDENVVERVADLVAKAKDSAPPVVPVINEKDKKNMASAIKAYKQILEAVEKEVGKVVIGQKNAIRSLLRALIADGHVLVEGVPGIAKTTLIRTLAKTTQCSFSRIQFTPDLLPTDIIGISTYQEGRGFYTLKGPIFSNFVLADEINRAPPKVQSALLESMAEKQATIAKESFPVPLPFFTMATQNPIESVGTYSLPEAQIDRFLFKVYMDYPTIDEEQDILRTNISEKAFDAYEIKGVLTPEMIIEIQELTKKIYVDKKVERYIVKLIDATRYPKKYHILSGKYVEFGASPRASIGLFKAAKAEALLQGQQFVTPHHVKTIAHDVLRHRLILTYEGQAEGLKPEIVIDEILKKIPVP